MAQTKSKSKPSPIEKELNKKIQRISIQSNQIRDKNSIALTRNRMLEIAQERNAFARKLYYTFISLIIFIILLALFIYSMNNRA